MPSSVRDDLLVLLADACRRQVLAALLDDPVGSVDLESCLAADDPSQASIEEVEQHLESLERAEVVEYDRADAAVARGERYERIEPLVRSVTAAGGSDRAERQRDELELLARAMRHDLVNSLNAVRARAAMLEPDGDPAAREHYEVVRDRVEEMLTRVETMAGLATAISGGRPSELDACDLRAVLSEEVETLRERHDEATVRWEGVPDVAVRADDRLSLVFDNLLRNAVEHSDRESPTVVVSGYRDGDSATVAVEDDGPGIPREQREAVFEAGSMGADSDGTGFGLHFVKRTVEDYGGEVAIEDRSPRGTRIRVGLRLAPEA